MSHGKKYQCSKVLQFDLEEVPFEEWSAHCERMKQSLAQLEIRNCGDGKNQQFSGWKLLLLKELVQESPSDQTFLMFNVASTYSPIKWHGEASILKKLGDKSCSLRCRI